MQPVGRGWVHAWKILLKNDASSHRTKSKTHSHFSSSFHLVLLSFQLKRKNIDDDASFYMKMIRSKFASKELRDDIDIFHKLEFRSLFFMSS